MMKKLTTSSLLICLLILLQACGFHLRGSQTTNNVDASDYVYVHTLNAGRVYQALQQQLGSSLKTTRSAADYEILVSNESIRQNVLSVSAATGKVEEFNINYACFLTIREVGGEKELVSNQRISLSKDYTFDEDAVLSKFEEQQLIENELIAEAAQAIVRRLNAVTK